MKTLAFSFDEFQAEARLAGREYPEPGTMVGKMFVGLRVAEEGGEVAGSVKRLARKETKSERQHLLDEMSDVLHALSQLADEYDFTLEQIAFRALIRQQRKGPGSGFIPDA